MTKHTRATPAGVPRGRSKFTRAQRKDARHFGLWPSDEFRTFADFGCGPSSTAFTIVDLLATPAEIKHATMIDQTFGPHTYPLLAGRPLTANA